MDKYYNSDQVSLEFMHHHKTRMRREIQKFFGSVRFWSKPIAATLSMKQAICQPSGHWEVVDSINASKNMLFFTSWVNRSVYGSSFNRYNKKLRWIPILEGEKDVRWHYHVVFEPPGHLSYTEVIDVVDTKWKRSRFGYHETEYKPVHDDGWLNYIMKPFGKDRLEAWTDCVSWQSVHLRDDEPRTRRKRRGRRELLATAAPLLQMS